MEIISSPKSPLIFNKKIVLFRGLKLLPLLLIILRDIKPSSTSYRGLTLDLLGVYSILISSSLKSIFSFQRYSLGLFTGFSLFSLVSLEYLSPILGGSKVLITSLLKRSLSSRLYRNVTIDVSWRFILKILFLLTSISRIIVIFQLRGLNT